MRPESRRLRAKVRGTTAARLVCWCETETQPAGGVRSDCEPTAGSSATRPSRDSLASPPATMQATRRQHKKATDKAKLNLDSIFSFGTTMAIKKNIKKQKRRKKIVDIN